MASVVQTRRLSAAGEFRRGWRFVLGAAIGAGFGLNGAPFYTLGLFLKPIAAEFGFTRGQVSIASVCLMAGTAVGGPMVGLLADRVDGRWIGLVSMAGLALGYLGLSRVGGDLDLFLASVLAMAMAACGTTPIVWTRIVNGWFDAARGAALALTLVGTGVAAVFGPPFVTAVMRDHGWRGAYVGLAIATAILAIPPVALLLRGSVRKAAAHEPAQAGVSAGEAIRLWDFWAIIASFLLISTCVSGGIVHLVPLLTDAGASAALAARLAGALGLAVVAGRLVIGALLDRFPAKYVAGVSLSLPIAGFVLLAQGAGSTPVAAIAAMTFGFSAGAEVDLIAFLTSRYFGLKAYGKIYSWALVPFALGGGLGPLAAGRVFDAFGSYRPALYGAAAMLSLGVLLLQTLGRYRFARLANDEAANDGTANDGAAEGHGAYPPPIAEAG